ncbi:hypothetical protein GCM10018952_33000 [Streptosporangium vulgare]
MLSEAPMRSPAYPHETLFTEGLDAEPDLWELGFSAIWIKGADLDALARAFCLDLATRTRPSARVGAMNPKVTLSNRREWRLRGISGAWAGRWGSTWTRRCSLQAR